MTRELDLAAAALAEALEAENAALRALDVPRAVAVFPHKEACARRLTEALSQPAAGGSHSSDSVSRLRVLADDNRRLLERAMFVQGRLLATLARAMPPMRAGYGRTPHPNVAAPPMTLSAHA